MEHLIKLTCETCKFNRLVLLSESTTDICFSLICTLYTKDCQDNDNSRSSMIRKYSPTLESGRKLLLQCYLH